MKKVFKNFVVLAVCLSMLLGSGLVVSAANTFQMSELEVGTILAEGDVLVADTDTWISVFYDYDKKPLGTGLNGDDIEGVVNLFGSGGFTVGEDTTKNSPYWEIVLIEPNIYGLNWILWPAEAPAEEDPTEEAPAEEDPTEEAPAEAEYTCVNHDFEWTVNYDATETKDGMMSYSCKHCGHVADTVKISAYAKFLQNTTEAIKKAPAGSTVKIKTDLWVSFSKAVAAALQTNPGVAIEVQFVYDGHVFQIVIPAGYDLMAKMNEDGYAGFAYLATDPALNLKWIR